MMHVRLAAYFAVFLVVVAILCGAYITGHHNGAKSVQVKWDAEQVAQKVAAIEQQSINVAKEREWNRVLQQAQDNAAAAKAQTQSDMDSTLTNLRSDNLRLRDKFRSCQSGVPKDTSAPQGNDAASEGGLSKQDQEFLVRIGAEADQVVHTLAQCQAWARAIQ